MFDGHSDDDDNDVIAFFTQYNNDPDSAGRPETDFTANSSVSGDAHGIDVNDPYGGLIFPQERKSNFYF